MSPGAGRMDPAGHVFFDHPPLIYIDMQSIKGGKMLYMQSIKSSVISSKKGNHQATVILNHPNPPSVD